MAEDEKFLERWSRKKREAADVVKAPDATSPVSEPTAAPNQHEAVDPQSTSPQAVEPPAFDPASLPPLESITAETDIRGFLSPGVPAELRDAALRRAWSADPAIRDFVGLVENGWDFNDPNGAPGFGPLPPGFDVKKMVAQVFGDIGDATSEDSAPDRPAAQPTATQEQLAPPSPRDADRIVAATPPVASEQDTGDDTVHRNINIAPQNKITDEAGNKPAQPRRHGGALPKL